MTFNQPLALFYLYGKEGHDHISKTGEVFTEGPGKHAYTIVFLPILHLIMYILVAII